jgi:cytochrome c oxidase cbb3-type subunit 1
MTSAPASPAADGSAVDQAGRVPLLFLLGSGLCWLVLSGILSFISAVQAHNPGFLSGCPALTTGRTEALAETSLIYGWIGDAGLALVLWILARLAGEPLRTARWVLVGGFFWNLGILAALIGIVSGDATALPCFELPRYVLPLLAAAYGAAAVGGVLAWTGRRREALFAAQWYGIAALFLFPWLLCAGQVTLLWFPLRGVVQAVAAGWYAQSLWTLWIAPIALAGAYYLAPKLTGKVLPAYEIAPAGFWTLVFIGGWTGGRHLIGGPVPAWIGTVAVVSGVLMLFHYLVVGLNLRPLLGNAGVAGRFAAAGITAYLLGGLVDALTGFHSVALQTQFTYFDEAQRQLALNGAATFVLYGVLYYAVPRLSGRPWFSVSLRRAHFGAAILGLALLVVGLAAAGLVQGRDLNDAQVSFATIAADTQSGLLAATAGQALLLLGNLLMLVNFLKTAACPFYAAEVRRSLTEASAT